MNGQDKYLKFTLKRRTSYVSESSPLRVGRTISRAHTVKRECTAYHEQMYTRMLKGTRGKDN